MTDGATSPEVVAYLERVPPPERALLERIRQIVRREAPAAEEVIAYGIPTFRLLGNLVHYAAYGNHLSFFAGSTLHDEALKDDLLGYRRSKGTIRFTTGKPLPDDLVARIVRIRIEENRALAASRKATQSGR